MTKARDLSPQMPGPAPTPAVVGAGPSPTDLLAAVLALPLPELPGALVALPDAQLHALITTENASEEPRAAVLAIVDAILAQRRMGVAQPTPGAIEGNTRQHEDATAIGDAKSFRHLRAKDVDAAQLDRPALTADGWVVPPAKPGA